MRHLIRERITVTRLRFDTDFPWYVYFPDGEYYGSYETQAEAMKAANNLIQYLPELSGRTAR